jgi:hypothetical protein
MMHKEAWLQSISFRYDTFTPDPPGCVRAIIIIDNLFNTRQAAQWTVECNCIRAAGELQAIGSRQNRTAVDAYKKLGHYVTRRFPEVPEHKRQTPAGPTRAKSNRYHMPHRARASQLTHAQTSSLLTCSHAQHQSRRHFKHGCKRLCVPELRSTGDTYHLESSGKPGGQEQLDGFQAA